MEKTDVLIYGYDYENTERIIDAYTEGTVDFTSSYIDSGVHREDKLICHLRIKSGSSCPYIPVGQADILRVQTCEDAGRFAHWIKENGNICIDEDADNKVGNI